MSNKKVKFSILNLFEKTQKEIVRLQLTVKGLFAIIIGSQIIQEKPEQLLYITLLGAIIDMLVGCFYIEENNEIKD